MKKIIFLFAIAFICVTDNLYASSIQCTNDKVLSKNEKIQPQKKIREEFIAFYLHNDGCFYLFRVTVIYGVNMTSTFYAPLSWPNYIGMTSFCPYQDVIHEMC